MLMGYPCELTFTFIAQFLSQDIPALLGCRPFGAQYDNVLKLRSLSGYDCETPGTTRTTSGIR